MRKQIAFGLALTLASFGALSASAKEDGAIKNIDQQIADAGVNKDDPQWRTKLKKPTAATFDADRSYYMDMETNKGSIRIKFMPGHAPMHVTSFMYLSRLGFFDGLNFHRVIPGFMAQGGCPLGTGTGSPGYRFAGEYRDDIKHDRPGLLSMANAGPGTDGSQFFLTFVPTPHLNGKHTIFGEIVEGMDTLKAIEPFGSRPRGQTREPIKIVKTTVSVE